MTKQLKIICCGTKDFIDYYSDDLAEDCNRFGYEFEKIVTISEHTYSAINHQIQKDMVDYMTWNNHDNERVCFLDPECRIVKPIPKNWIESKEPHVFYKVDHGQQQTSRYVYGATLPTNIIMQPIFVSRHDLIWMQWWLDASISLSDLQNRQYVPQELLIQQSLNFNKIKYSSGVVTYNRGYTGKHEVVAGSWTHEDTIIQHPRIHATLDQRILPCSPERRDNKMLSERDLHNHYEHISYDTIQQIDQLMGKENLHDWPAETQIKDGWHCIDKWQFKPRTGQVKHQDYDMIKYHHSMIRKLDLGVKTPAVYHFNN
tara:strand:+ start:6675 stop:7619 length:945 start_codon:yes stop_codon:yes gene_type:complete